MLVWLGLVVESFLGVRLVVRDFRYVSTQVIKNYIRIFDKLLLTVRCGTGLVSDGERCYNMVRY